MRRFTPPWTSLGHAIRGHALFAKRLAANFAIGVSLIIASLFVGMLGYRYFEGLRWLDSFSHAAMILGGMGLTSSLKAMAGNCSRASTPSIRGCYLLASPASFSRRSSTT